VLKDILVKAAAAANTSADPTTKKLGVFYASCMDSSRADREGLAPIKGELDDIDRIQSKADLPRALARLHLKWVDAGFGTIASFASGRPRVWAYADMKNSTKNILWLAQGGMGLPEPGYYTRDDSASRALRTGYREHVARMLVLSGAEARQAASDAQAILALETRLATVSLSPEDQSEPTKFYVPTTPKALAALTPSFSWTEYFKGLGIDAQLPPDARISVAPTAYFRAFGAEVDRVPMPVWRAYLRWRLLSSVARTLGKSGEAENFRFAALMTGVTKPTPRSEYCTATADALMGMAIGKIYVARAFPPAAKRRIEALVADLRAVLRDRIKANDWMGPATKKAALAKVDTLRVEVGYPATWVDYSGVQLAADKPFVENAWALRTFNDRLQFAKLSRPVDRGEWEMSPATVNAYENPQFNALYFPAAILQPPFFSMDADDAVNYGATGMVIGHELTHFFDDQGRQFDERGNLRDWWQPDDAKRYQDRADIVVKQYDSYLAIDTLHLKGKQTLNENIADIGGLTIAYFAFQRALAAHPTSKRLFGYTPVQQFFIGTAQSWRQKLRPQEARRRVFTDGHSLDYWRVNGPFSSVPEFGAAFGCKAGDAMVRPPEARARLW
jgi:predicted metalloendopeptidase